MFTYSCSFLGAYAQSEDLATLLLILCLMPGFTHWTVGYEPTPWAACSDSANKQTQTDELNVFLSF